MKIIGYKRRILDRVTDLETLFNAVAAQFGAEGFNIKAKVEGPREQEVEFSLELGGKELKSSSAIGFFKRNVVGVIVDNQAFNDGFFVRPSSLIQIETIEDNTGSTLGMEGYLALTKTLTAAMELDLALVIGTKENIADYYRTPLGCGIGLIKVFWINCFGSEYSALIPEGSGSTHFFKCEKFGHSSMAFVSAPTYQLYQSASPELLSLQKQEIGEDLFNRLPVEKQREGGSYWLFDPRVILGVFTALARQRLTDWHRYQAKVVPNQYQME